MSEPRAEPGADVYVLLRQYYDDTEVVGVVTSEGSARRWAAERDPGGWARTFLEFPVMVRAPRTRRRRRKGPERS